MKHILVFILFVSVIGCVPVYDEYYQPTNPGDNAATIAGSTCGHRIGPNKFIEFENGKGRFTFWVNRQNDQVAYISFNFFVNGLKEIKINDPVVNLKSENGVNLYRFYIPGIKVISPSIEPSYINRNELIKGYQFKSVSTVPFVLAEMIFTKESIVKNNVIVMQFPDIVIDGVVINFPEIKFTKKTSWYIMPINC